MSYFDHTPREATRVSMSTKFVLNITDEGNAYLLSAEAHERLCRALGIEPEESDFIDILDKITLLQEQLAEAKPEHDDE